MAHSPINVFSARPALGAAALKPFFGPVASDGGWLRRPTWYGFATPSGRVRMTVAGEEYWVQQRSGLKGYAATMLAGDRAAATRFDAMVDGFVSIYSLHAETAIIPGDATFQLLERFAGHVGGVIFTAGGIHVPGRGLLFGPGAPVTVPESDLRGIVRTAHDHPRPTAGQLARRTRSAAIIRALGLPVLDTLPVIDDDAQATLRAVAEVVRRLLCIAVCAAKAEGAEPALITRLIDRYRVREWFSPQERDFLAAESPTDRQRATFAWRYECAHVLEWWLGLAAVVLPANELCVPKDVVGHLIDVSTTDLVARASPRSVAETLDQADLHYRLHWATIHLRVADKTSDQADEEIVMERHYALNWLIRYRDADWDDVSTDT